MRRLSDHRVRLGLGMGSLRLDRGSEDFSDRARLGLSVGSWRLEKRTKDQKVFRSGALGPWHGQLAA